MKTERLYHKRTICIGFSDEEFYNKCMNDRLIFRQYLDDNYNKYPELFPTEFKNGYILYGFTECSKKIGIKKRRIKLKDGTTYQIRPSFVMPYMTGRTDDVEKALYLKRFGVPDEALAYVFGHSTMYWYRCMVSFGRNSIVGTTIKSEDRLPDHVIADEKHTWSKSQRIYVATTVSGGCILGSALSSGADTISLMKGYQVFKEESQNIKEDYSPVTVNTDGWDATKKAWKILFPCITFVLCFLHSFLNIRLSCKKQKYLLKIISDKLWKIYNLETLAKFSQRMRRFKEWVELNLNYGVVREKVLSLCDKSSQFKTAYRNPGSYRTSNELDRLMNYQDRLLYSMQYFHGTWESAELYIRAISLLWNFHPYCRTIQTYTGRYSPFEDINGFQYHKNWLHNLMIASSLGGRKC